MRLMLAASLANLPFGTIYAFSVLLRPIESLLGLQRTDLTLVFALATMVLTLGMNLAPVLYPRLALHHLLGIAAALSAAGLLITATAETLLHLVAGYGVLFGLGAGLVFTTVQHRVNQAEFARRGLVNGYVVSLYPLGAMLGAPLMGWAIAEIGLRPTLLALAATLGASVLGAAWLLRPPKHSAIATLAEAPSAEASAILAAPSGHQGQPGHRGHRGQSSQSPRSEPFEHRGLFLRLSAVFTLAASAGLMVMSQAAGIMQAYGAGLGASLAATTVITGAIALARILGGWLVDRFPVSQVMAGAQLWALSGAVLLSLWPTASAAVPCLTMIGMGYGLISGASAAAIGQWWPMALFGLVAGRLYIGWCAAAISLPLIAATLYDASGNYSTAIVLAGAFNAVALLVALRLRQTRTVSR
ncbi:MAG: OFA family MFS transporter [Betaproteobacteria bacterium]|nr:OFA family MFS transporter [Betaproteobacteria bacterium]